MKINTYLTLSYYLDYSQESIFPILGEVGRENSNHDRDFIHEKKAPGQLMVINVRRLSSVHYFFYVQLINSFLPNLQGPNAMQQFQNFIR